MLNRLIVPSSSSSSRALSASLDAPGPGFSEDEDASLLLEDGSVEYTLAGSNFLGLMACQFTGWMPVALYALTIVLSLTTFLYVE